MFLAVLEECENYYGISPVVSFDYTSPCDSEIYGTISLTFYPSTSRLLVQGTSYLLWIDEHLPIVHQRAEDRYQRDIGIWRGLIRRRGISVKLNSTSLRGERTTFPILTRSCTKQSPKFSFTERRSPVGGCTVQ